MNWLREPHLCYMKKHEQPSRKKKKVIDRGKRIKTRNEVKPVENKNSETFL